MSIKKIVTFFGLGLLCELASAVCYVELNPTLIRESYTPSYTASKTAIDEAIKAFDLGAKKVNQFEGNVTAAGVNVLTSQKAITATQLSTAIKNNSQIQATAEASMNLTKQLQKVADEYGPNGQGHRVCQEVISKGAVVEDNKSIKESVPYMIDTEVTARPGRYAPRGAAMAERLALHDKLYCTEAQAESGLCHGAAPREAKDLLAETMFNPAPKGSSNYADKSAFINNMVGLPDDPITPQVATTLEGQQYADLKRRKDAIKSTALNSLKTLQAEYSVVTTVEQDLNSSSASATSATTATSSTASTVGSTETQQLSAASAGVSNARGSSPSGSTSFAQKLKADVDQYLGAGKPYEDWSKTLVSANERGVLKEVLQVKALRLYLQAQQYQQLARIESMLAANVSAETYRTGMEGSIDSQRQFLVSKNIQAAMAQANQK